LLYTCSDHSACKLWCAHFQAAYVGRLQSCIPRFQSYCSMVGKHMNHIIHPHLLTLQWWWKIYTCSQVGRNRVCKPWNTSLHKILIIELVCKKIGIFNQSRDNIVNQLKVLKQAGLVILNDGKTIIFLDYHTIKVKEMHIGI